LIFFMASLSRSATTEFGRSSGWGMFLSRLAAFHRFPGKSSGGPILGFSCEPNFPHVLVVVLRLRSVSPFTTRRFQRAATPALLLPLKRRPLRRRSPHPRFVRTISPVAYTFGLPTIGRGRASPVMTQDHFLQGATCSTFNGSPAVTVCLLERRSSGSTSSASPRGGGWHTMPAETPSPGVFLPGSFAAAPSPDPPVGRP
jgi:hypothetical protein